MIQQQRGKLTDCALPLPQQMAQMRMRRGNRRISENESSRAVAARQVHGLIGVPPTYEKFLSGVKVSAPDDDSVSLNFGEDAPEEDELLEHLTVCISVYNNHASVHLILGKGMFDTETSMGWNTLQINEKTNLRVIHLAFHEGSTNSYDVYYENLNLIGSTRRYFVVSKIQSMHLSLVLASMTGAFPVSYVEFENDCLEFAKVYCQVLHSIADIELDSEMINTINSLTITGFRSERSVRADGMSHSLAPSAALSLRAPEVTMVVACGLVMYIAGRLLYFAEQKMWQMMS